MRSQPTRAQATPPERPKSSFHNDACAVGPRWAARCGVLGRARMPAYERGLRPCLAVAHRTPTMKAIMKRALRAFYGVTPVGPRLPGSELVVAMKLAPGLRINRYPEL